MLERHIELHVALLPHQDVQQLDYVRVRLWCEIEEAAAALENVGELLQVVWLESAHAGGEDFETVAQTCPPPPLRSAVHMYCWHSRKGVAFPLTCLHKGKF